MTVPKIEEKTLYPPLINHLQKIGFRAVGETKVRGKEPDILFCIDDVSFVLEVKIGRPDVGLKAVAQVSDYGRKLNTSNSVVLIYPEEHKRQPVLFSDMVQKMALEEEVHALVLTEYWTESLVSTPAYIFETLKSRVINKQPKIDFGTIVKLIESYVRDLNSIVNQIKGEGLIYEVVDKLDLFASIGEIKDKKTAERQVANLASYLLFNQLLFYHIYNKKNLYDRLPELQNIRRVGNLQAYFDQIQAINYRSIYKVNILGHIPDTRVVIDTLNEVMKAIKMLRAEHVTHDLAGRFFHDLIPFEVRKVLAAFYTHPVAADVLANLSINSWDNTVLDPACGSGTLLVAAYKSKEKKYRDLYGFGDLSKMHKRFVENDLTGIDIMPFAAHISAINLTMQNIEQRTNTVRIATFDSLESAALLKSRQFEAEGIKISPYTTEIQRTMFEASGSAKKQTKGGPVSAEGAGSDFDVKPVDVVIMNPPFSDREKMPVEMRTKLKGNQLASVCGNQVNLWGYFVALADLLLKPNGTMATVIPINFARGKATAKIRDHILHKFTIKYIIKPVGDDAFSESSAFKDILLIAEKKQPLPTDRIKIVMMKQSVKKSCEGLAPAIDRLPEIETDCEGDIYDVLVVSHHDLVINKQNLMPFLAFSSIKNVRLMLAFRDRLKQCPLCDKYVKGDMLVEGFHASPQGLSDLVFVTEPVDESRTRQCFMIHKHSKKNHIICAIKHAKVEVKVPKAVLKPAIRTIAGIRRVCISQLKDYLIADVFDDFTKVYNLSSWIKTRRFTWSVVRANMTNRDWYLAIPSRFRMNSKNTSVIAVYGDKRFYAPHTFKMIMLSDKKRAKRLTVVLNSVLFLSSFQCLSSQTTLGFIDLRESDIVDFLLMNIDELSNNQAGDIDRLFEDIKDESLPSIVEQLETRHPARIKLDRTVMSILGFPKHEVDEWLTRVYDVLVDELQRK